MTALARHSVPRQSSGRSANTGRLIWLGAAVAACGKDDPQAKLEAAQEGLDELKLAGQAVDESGTPVNRRDPVRGRQLQKQFDDAAAKAAAPDDAGPTDADMREEVEHD